MVSALSGAEKSSSESEDQREGHLLEELDGGGAHEGLFADFALVGHCLSLRLEC